MNVSNSIQLQKIRSRRKTLSQSSIQRSVRVPYETREELVRQTGERRETPHEHFHFTPPTQLPRGDNEDPRGTTSGREWKRTHVCAPFMEREGLGWDYFLTRLRTVDCGLFFARGVVFTAVGGGGASAVRTNGANSVTPKKAYRSGTSGGGMVTEFATRISF
jgi:hypothetical protein